MSRNQISDEQRMQYREHCAFIAFPDPEPLNSDVYLLIILSFVIFPILRPGPNRLSRPSNNAHNHATLAEQRPRERPHRPIGHPEDAGDGDCVRTRWRAIPRYQRLNGNRANAADTAYQLESARASTASK
jgi:hypothetical protein